MEPFATGFDLAAVGGPVRGAIDGAILAADSVHGLPLGITPVPVATHHPREPLGQYRGTNAGQPVNLTISTAAPDHAFTFVHEAGHYLDHHVMGAGGQLASSGPEWDDWRDAVRQSAATQRLRQIMLNPQTRTVMVNGVEVAFVESPHYAAYLLGVHEVFARSYSQYIAERAGDPTLAAELAAALLMPYPEQWEGGDFDPIRDAFTAVFTARGWLRP
jgi:hypothetical protein